MTLTRIYRWVRKVWGLLVLLAALFGVHPGKPLPIPGMPIAPPAAPPSPAPAPAAPASPAKKVIGQCATGEGHDLAGKLVGYYAVCVVDGSSYTLPGGNFATRAAAQQAIRDFRAANA